MKLQAKSSRVLAAALQKSMRCIESRNTIAILDNVLLSKHEDGNLYFTSASTDAQLTIPAPLMVCNGQFGGPLALPIKIISQYLATLPDCTVTLDFVSDSTLQLEYCTGDDNNVKEGKVTIPYYDGKDFPTMAVMGEEKLHITLPGGRLLDVIGKTSSFVSFNELHPTMNALCIDVAEDMSEVIFVGTDGRILLKHTYSNNPDKGGGNFFVSGHPEKVLVPVSHFRPLAAFDRSENIDIISDGHAIRFTSSKADFLCKSIEGRYPNYNSVIPRNNPYHVCFSKKEMLSILKRVRLFGTADDLVELRKEGMFFNVSAQDIDNAQGAEDQVVIGDAECPDGFHIGFKGENFARCLNALDSDDVRLQMSDSKHPGVMTVDIPAPDTLSLIMPMVLED